MDRLYVQDLLTGIAVSGTAGDIGREVLHELARREAGLAVSCGQGVGVGVTGREREVLVLVASGLSNTEIADRLHLSLGTVKTHVSRLLAKLDVRDRAQLVIVAYESGLVSAARP